MRLCKREHAGQVACDAAFPPPTTSTTAPPRCAFVDCGTFCCGTGNPTCGPDGQCYPDVAGSSSFTGNFAVNASCAGVKPWCIPDVVTVELQIQQSGVDISGTITVPALAGQVELPATGHLTAPASFSFTSTHTVSVGAVGFFCLSPVSCPCWGFLEVDVQNVTGEPQPYPTGWEGTFLLQ